MDWCKSLGKVPSIGTINFPSVELKWEVIVTPAVSELFLYSGLLSTKFSIGLNNNESLWRLILGKGTCKKSGKDKVLINLANLNRFEVKFNCKFTLSFADDETKISRDMDDIIMKPCSLLTCDNLWPDDIDKLDNFKNFTILCEIKIKNDEATQTFLDNQSSQLINESLFTNERLSDVTIVAGERQFFLHKCILANRSSVFEKMFETDMVEKQKSTINIPDLDPDILHAFFKYLYTNKIENLSQTACDLLCVAEKYLVMELKSLCEKSMCDTLNVDNAIEYLKLADMYNVKILKNSVIKYVCEYIDVFQNSSTSNDSSCFKSLSKDLLVEILNNMAKKSK